jgi:tRNA modification GTPase
VHRCEETIAAVASAHGPAARGIVRVSGPAALACVADGFRPADGAVDWTRLVAPRRVAGWLAVPRSSDERGECVELPVALLVWPTSRSYTREPCVEIHAPGSPPLLDAIVARLCRSGARPARPGEFTLRAFLAGRIDLPQAEAVLGVIDARGEGDLQAALEQLAGGMSRPLHTIRSHLLDVLAEIEAGLDFADEDLEFIRRDEVAARLGAASQVVADAREQLARRGQRPARPRVALVGRPNAGKSSLFNALVARYAVEPAATRALVADVPGTTRDCVAASLVLDGLACELVDTAGLDAALEAGGDAADVLHRLAQQAARETSRQVELQLLCLPADSADASEPERLVAAWRRAAGERLEVVRTKADLRADSPEAVRAKAPAGIVACSARDGWGVDAVAAAIRARLAELPHEATGAAAVALTARRCLASLDRAAAALDAARQHVRDDAGDELLAEELRAALTVLAEVVGAVCADDVLDRIFSQFCIGK